MDAPSSAGVSGQTVHIQEPMLTPSKTPLFSESNEGQLAAIMSDSFRPFDSQTGVVQPFQEENALDTQYEMGKCDMFKEFGRLCAG